ncbi:MAG: tetratricopeptide repeat protein [Anaerolineae bacterium]|nr:tetratricopeptide repeat protein [Anaerolineae bacterium]
MAQRRRRLLRNGVIIGAVMLILLAVASVAYHRFLAPDPLTRQTMALLGEAETLLDQGDFPGALEKYQAVLDIAPTNTEALIWTGVLAQQLGQEERARQAFAAARAGAESEVGFLIERGMAYVRLNQLDAAQADAEAALALDPNSAEAHFLLGGVYESQGRSQEAIAEWQQAADLAQQSGNNALYVLISTRLAMLLQTVGLTNNQ